jgi:hypothetical protein
MFLGRLAGLAITTKCKQDSLGADEDQVELGGRLSPVTKRETDSFKENNTMSTGSSFNPQREISDQVGSKFFH